MRVTCRDLLFAREVPFAAIGSFGDDEPVVGQRDPTALRGERADALARERRFRGRLVKSTHRLEVFEAARLEREDEAPFLKSASAFVHAASRAARMLHMAKGKATSDPGLSHKLVPGTPE